MECHYALRDRLLVDFIVTYDNDMDEDSWKGVAEMLSSESTSLDEKVEFLQALFPALESKFDGDRLSMEKFVEELVEITQQPTLPAVEVTQRGVGKNGKDKEVVISSLPPFTSSSSSPSVAASASVNEEENIYQRRAIRASYLKIFERHGIYDSEIDEETLEYLTDVLGNEMENLDRSDQLELLQMYVPHEVDNQEELLDDMIALSKQTIKLRKEVEATATSTSPCSLSLFDRNSEAPESTELAWMASEENKECKKSILQMYNKEFVTGPGDIVEKKVSGSSSSKSKKQFTKALLNPTLGGDANKIRYRDGEIVARKGEKFITVENPNDDYDGGSRGKVKLKGKRGVGWVNG